MGYKKYDKFAKNVKLQGKMQEERKRTTEDEQRKFALSNERPEEQRKISMEEEQRKYAFANEKPEEKIEKTIEEEQKEFASEKMHEEKYTLENQKEYIDYLNKMFIEGKINSKNIGRVKRELLKYPDKVESSMFLSEIYYAITEKEEIGIEQINKLKNKGSSLSEEEHKTLDEKVNEFRKRIDLKEYLAKKEEADKIREKELRQEQREYSREIIRAMDNGELTKEDVPQIARKLEGYPDRSRAIFLIMKLYEGYYDNSEALRTLIRYNSISDLSDSEKDMLVQMRNSIAENKKKNINPLRLRQHKVRVRKIKNLQYKKNKKENQKNRIEDMLKQGETIKSIQMQAMISGDVVSLKSISSIRNHLIATDDEMKNRYEEEMTMAKQLVDGGFSVEQIYDLFGSNIGKNKLVAMKADKER